MRCDKDNPNIYAYTREGEGKKMLILLNFSAIDAQANISADLKNSKLLLSNYAVAPGVQGSTIDMKPYQAAVYELAEQ